ncbi:hypothetical protein IA57_05280 [Mangrovimonas yunxiaonensis]|uniref:Uncharacterized protein n=1 Tax=Mangrovimonas yunxiaonensis TaxID=1197477 RepID=A0A084TKK8_9FLAO|nr:hypothetical protein [Mangrovimonas yunxiaonensis]KFB01244.1 hypothetical protein IA57_05280 [Mangrovimonas yunxiaonensis]GGH37832.1 hypothetical protein GCM10011364_06130 [Mangrovimonas yunxiaonensis]
MKEFVFKSIVFTSLFVFLAAYVSKSFQGNSIELFSHNQYKSLQNKIDVAIFGTSHAYATYDPRVLEAETGLKTFNFGSPLQNISTSEFLMRKVIESNDLKLIIIDVFSESIKEITPNNEFKKRFQYKVLDNFGFSKEKLMTIRKIGEMNPLNSIPLYKNHSNWERIFESKEYKINQDIDYYSGFHTAFVLDKKTWDKHENNLKKVKFRNNTKEQLTLGEKKSISRILNFSQESNIPVLFVCAPFFKEIRGKQSISYQENIKNYLDSIGADYVDFNPLWKKIKLNKYDFVDPDHLNSRGALKVSLYLSDYILKRYNTFNKRELPSKNNRYLIAKNNSKEIIWNSEIKDSYVNDSLHVNKVYLFKVFDDKYEILIEGEKDKLKRLNTCLQYQMNYSDKIEKNCKWLNGYLEYNDKNFLSYQINLDLKKIKDMKFFIGPNKKKLIIKMDKFKHVR